MALDETLAMAHISVGWITLAYDWQWEKAKQSFERARELNPNDPYVYQGLAWHFVIADRFNEAIEMIQAALKLDPLHVRISNNLAFMYSDSGQVERAIEQRNKTLELDPGRVSTISGLAEDYLRMSMYPEAVTSVNRAMTLAGRTPQLVMTLARAYALSGEKEEAKTLLQELQQLLQELQQRDKSEYVLPVYFAALHVVLGNTDEAFQWLEKGYKERNWSMLFLRTSSWWDPLRSDPRFDDFVRRMKYPE
jgi:tetratricopeptide (TPR) repeat protein